MKGAIALFWANNIKRTALFSGLAFCLALNSLDSFARIYTDSPCEGVSSDSNQHLIKYLVKPKEKEFRYEIQVNISNKGFVPAMRSSRKIGLIALSDNRKYLAFTVYRGPYVVLYVSDLHRNTKQKINTFDAPLKALNFSSGSRCIYHENSNGESGISTL